MPEGRFSFSPKALQKLPVPTSGRVVVHDSREPSLSLRCDPTGARTFFWIRSIKGYTETVRDPVTGQEERKYHGRNAYRTLGEWPSVSIKHARIEAGKLETRLADWRASNYAGPNPFEAPSDVPTLAAVLDDYIEKRVHGHAANPERAEKATRWLIDKYVPWKNRTLDAISDRDVRGLHQHIGVGQKHKIVANRVLEVLRRLYRWAEKQKLYIGENPAKDIDYFARVERERFLGDKEPDELRRMMVALHGCENRDLRDFVLLSLFTGARRSDVSSMRWQDVTETGWHIPHSKGNRTYTVPLVPEAIEILEQRRKLVDPENPFVFPGAGRSGHIVEWKRSYKGLLKRAGIAERLTIHDLRRTAGAMQAASGASLLVIGKSLGHASGSPATKIYARLNLEPVRQSMTAAVAMMTATQATAKPATPRKAQRLALPAARLEKTTR